MTVIKDFLNLNQNTLHPTDKKRLSKFTNKTRWIKFAQNYHNPLLGNYLIKVYDKTVRITSEGVVIKSAVLILWTDLADISPVWTIITFIRALQEWPITLLHYVIKFVLRNTSLRYFLYIHQRCRDCQHFHYHKHAIFIFIKSSIKFRKCF